MFIIILFLKFRFVAQLLYSNYTINLVNTSTAALDYDGVNLLSVSELQKYTLIEVLNFSIILLSFLCHIKIL